MRARVHSIGWPLLLWLGVLLVLMLLSVVLTGNPASIDRTCLGGCPPSAQHWLGTDGLGRDVGLQLVFGASNALMGGIVAAFSSLGIGYVLGAAAAWHGRGKAVLPWWSLLLLMGLLVLSSYWWWVLPIGKAVGLSVLGLMGIAAVVKLVNSLDLPPQRMLSPWLSTGVKADRLLLFTAEVTSSVPALLLLLALAALAFRPGLWQLVLVYVSVRWTNFAVLSLQEVRQALAEPYAEAAHLSGVRGLRVLLRHVLPNVLAPLGVLAVLSVSGFIIVEGTFAFLGLGLPAQDASWGRVLAQAQQVRGGWWLWVFPGSLLVGTVLCLQVLARRLRGGSRF